jgi:hypothetical protein
MYFNIKNYLKSNHYYITKHSVLLLFHEKLIQFHEKQNIMYKVFYNDILYFIFLF